MHHTYTFSDNTTAIVGGTNNNNLIYYTQKLQNKTVSMHFTTKEILLHKRLMFNGF